MNIVYSLSSLLPVITEISNTIRKFSNSQRNGSVLAHAGYIISCSAA